MNSPATSNHTPPRPTALTVALALAADGDHVGPCCWPINGACGCGMGHTDDAVGKAPLTKHGHLDFTRDPTTIKQWFTRWPEANVAKALKPSGQAMVDPDSPAAHDEVAGYGLEGGQVRQSRNTAYLFDRPADCPAVSVKRIGRDGHLDVLADGYAMVYGIHRNGAPIRVLDGRRGELPTWAVVLLQQAEQNRAREAVAFTPDPGAAAKGAALWPKVRADCSGRVVQAVEGGPRAYVPRALTPEQVAAGGRPPDPSASGADACVITALVELGLDDDQIFQIYSAHPIGTAGKFAQRGGAKYLARSIGKQRAWLKRNAELALCAPVKMTDAPTAAATEPAVALCGTCPAATLQAENAALVARLAKVERVNKLLRQRIVDVHAMHTATLDTMRNKTMRQAAPTAVVLATKLASAAQRAQARGEAPAPVRITIGQTRHEHATGSKYSLATLTNRSARRITTDLEALEKCGLQVERRAETRQVTDPATGKYKLEPITVLYASHPNAADGAAAILHTVATYTPPVADTNEWGGKRERREHCPDHPDAALVERGSVHCSICQYHVHELPARPHPPCVLPDQPPARQDDRHAAAADATAPANVERTIRRQLCPTPQLTLLPPGKLKPCPGVDCTKEIPRQWTACAQHEPRWRERLDPQAPAMAGGAE